MMMPNHLRMNSYSSLSQIRDNFNENGTPHLYDIPHFKSRLDEFATISQDELVKLVLQYPNKSCELDPAPTGLVKSSIDALAPSLTKLVNISLSTSTVPKCFKEAVITPLIKKTDGGCIMKNYRPVSGLPFISKIIEKTVSKQLKLYKLDNNLGEPLQSAYKKNHSTETALIKVYDDILSKMDKRNVVLLTLLDLSAAFDTVDHGILLYRLEHTFGIKNKALGWIKSYLTDRSQYVSVKGMKSESVKLKCCVPQGSILGPEFYCDYTTPLGVLLRILLILFKLYADDTQLQKSLNPNNKDVQFKAIKDLEADINVISNWMFDNKLKLNGDKTEFLTIASSQQHKKLVVDRLNLGGDEIMNVKSVRNLGVITDNQMDMKDHVSHISKVCFFQIRNIRKIRCYLSTEATKKLVQTLVISRLDYCNSLLYGINEGLLNKLQRVQNAAARLISKTSKYDHITPVLLNLHWLKIRQRIKYKLLTITFKVMLEGEPKYLSDMLSWKKASRTLRSNEEKQLQEQKWNNKTHGFRSFSVSAPMLWNELPPNLKNCTSLSAFKKVLKTHLFKECYNL